MRQMRPREIRPFIQITEPLFDRVTSSDSKPHALQHTELRVYLGWGLG